MSEHRDVPSQIKRRPPAPAPVDVIDKLRWGEAGNADEEAIAEIQKLRRLANLLDDRLRTVDLRSVIQNVITRCHDRGEGFDIMALEAACAVRDALRGGDVS